MQKNGLKKLIFVGVGTQNPKPKYMTQKPRRVKLNFGISFDFSHRGPKREYCVKVGQFQNLKLQLPELKCTYSHET
jgi:hypothetical protein